MTELYLIAPSRPFFFGERASNLISCSSSLCKARHFLCLPPRRSKQLTRTRLTCTLKVQQNGSNNSSAAYKTPQRSYGYRPSPQKTLCIFLARLSWPLRLHDMMDWFGCSRSQLSTIFNDVAIFLCQHFRNKLFFDRPVTAIVGPWPNRLNGLP